MTHVLVYGRRNSSFGFPERTYRCNHPAGGDPRRRTERGAFVQPVALWERDERGVWHIVKVVEQVGRESHGWHGPDKFVGAASIV